MICSTLECCSEAVAKSKISGEAYCLECALRVMKAHGPSALVTISGAKFPWKYPVEGQCTRCNVEYNKYLIGRGGECPNCRVDLPQFKK